MLDKAIEFNIIYEKKNIKYAKDELMSLLSCKNLNKLSFVSIFLEHNE